MNILADEGVDGPIVDRPRREGHRVWYVAEMAPAISDEDVLALANGESAVLPTADTDFGELIYRQGRLATGVVLLRLAGLSPTRKSEVVSLAIREHAGELRDAFTVVRPGAVRIRRRDLTARKP